MTRALPAILRGGKILSERRPCLLMGFFPMLSLLFHFIARRGLGKLRSWFPSALFLSLSSCATFDHGSQTARTVEPGKTLYSASYHITLDHLESPLDKRLKGDFHSDFNSTQLSSSVSAGMRYGLSSHIDTGLRLNLDHALVDVKLGSFGGTRWRVGVGASASLPTLSVLSPETYYGGLAAYASYDLASNAIAYLDPLYVYVPQFHGHQDVWGLSTGLIVGKKTGLLLGYDYYHTPALEAGYEQYKIGVVQGIDYLQGKSAVPEVSWLSILLEAGFVQVPYPSLGVTAQFPTGMRWTPEFSVAMGAGWAPAVLEEKEGWILPSLVSLGGVYDVTPVYGIGAALARRQVFFTANGPTGWVRGAAYSHGIQASFRQTWTTSSLEWIGVYIPLPFLPQGRSLSAREGEAWENPTEQYQDLARRLERLPSVQFLRYRMLL